MHARVTIIHVAQEKLAEATGIFKNSVVPAVKAQKGSRGAYLLADPKTGKGLAITLWETEADMLAGDGGFHQEQVAKFKHLYTAPPLRETYEVMVQPDAAGV
jgi:heme-degrading monooxygenase HmoA